jgi:ribose-phosphate pyrophosphokinase
MQDDLRVFAGSSNPALARELCHHLRIELSELRITRFSNDNLFVQVMENVRDRDVFVVQSLTAPVSDHVMELLITLDALRSASARRITAVIPYYSYARSDKKDAPRISIVGRLMADLLHTAGANRVLTMDLHAPQVHGFFSIPVDHLTAIPLIADHIAHRVDMDRAVVVATDSGGARRAGRFADRLKVPIAFIDKRRVGDTSVHQGLVVGDVEGRHAIIFEDEVATGTTLLSSVRTLVEAKVCSVIAGATHGVLCNAAPDNIHASALDRLIVTNTVDIPEHKLQGKIRVLSVAPLLAEAIRRIHTGESMGAMFKAQ